MTSGHVRKVSKAESKQKCKHTTDYREYEWASYDSTDRYPLSILKFPKDTQKQSYHPTQKPVALLEYLIKTYTNEGMIILDNCMGSGSTVVAAINTGRKYVGFELDPGYFNIAKQRIEESRRIA